MFTKQIPCGNLNHPITPWTWFPPKSGTPQNCCWYASSTAIYSGPGLESLHYHKQPRKSNSSLDVEVHLSLMLSCASLWRTWCARAFNCRDSPMLATSLHSLLKKHVIDIWTIPKRSRCQKRVLKERGRKLIIRVSFLEILWRWGWWYICMTRRMVVEVWNKMQQNLKQGNPWWLGR